MIIEDGPVWTSFPHPSSGSHCLTWPHPLTLSHSLASEDFIRIHSYVSVCPSDSMASLLRQLVAGPRAPHPEANLDLCYVTSNIIVISGPSATWPKRAYRNPLDKTLQFLDERHGEDWAIWEFRAEGTGYPDEAVYGRIRHYPWPDHHPPPFRLVPMIMASMRNWLHGGELHHSIDSPEKATAAANATTWSGDDEQEREEEEKKKKEMEMEKEKKKQRVAVVHCKAGKGRSGTVACSYLISECGWKPDEALTRFTERRMRPKFGPGVSIPSQLRTIGYVDRWTRHGKRYVERPVEIVEVHVWGLRDGVKIDVQGFADGGRRIKVFHTFTRNERHIVEGNPPDSGGMGEMMRDLAGVSVSQAVDNVAGDAKKPGETIPEEGEEGEEGKEKKDEGRDDASSKPFDASETNATTRTTRTTTSDTQPHMDPAKGLSSRAAMFLLQTSNDISALTHKAAATVDETLVSSRGPYSEKSSLRRAAAYSDVSEAEGETQQQQRQQQQQQQEQEEPGGKAVILRPETPVRIPNSDVNIAVERRNRTSTSLGLTMVTAVAHVWFNGFFEGNGPEQGGKADASGVFAIDWDSMDGIKGSSRKGARALDRMAVVWRVPGAAAETAGAKVEETEAGGELVYEPAEGSEVPQMEPADWTGGDHRAEPSQPERDLGLRVANPASADVSKASSVKSVEVGGKEGEGERMAEEEGQGIADELDSLAGVRVSGPAGEEELGGQQDAGNGKRSREG
ncbi:hypothetical protein SODALDRAFT_375273 [Sodiomyces alkalinus F11]|uniref:phosphatidylinositol-3,4,5-trisphosphate 3-phosphatase n=1 Tax=Sodiomyces alkalinus (strain CBS 110278 / VKM F-3762 / F11) TaxID=1314773 RepID=A0A3N2Q8I0_SODAK|nr:hypothetical protein SODALDRAFT_375273 [Sodiomyces alkalinus F11]ROT43050.1 hypothetical protein SODALDRAFT_375273 [Sodiomyces alkalinus F11]